MAENSLIAWTRHTFNPWMGCMKVSAGCANCYAETLTTNRMGFRVFGPPATTERKVTSDTNWRKPLKWNREAQLAGVADRVFCASLADVFEDHPTANAARPRLWNLVRDTPFLWWLILTKRPERIRAELPADWGPGGYPNVWLGTSVEDMRVAGRVDHLRDIPAAVRFISYEPALGPLDELELRGVDWVIYGGESGPGYRPHDLAWPRAMRAKCAEEGVAFFYKQSSAARTEMGIELDGEIVRQYPVPNLAFCPVLPPHVRRAYERRVDADARPAALDTRARERAALPVLEGGAR